MSLAEELMADLEAAGDEQFEDEALRNGELEDVGAMDMDFMEGVNGNETSAMSHYSSVSRLKVSSLVSSSVRSIAKLRDSEHLSNIVSRIKAFQQKGRRTQVIGPVEVDPEYQLIVEANNLAVEIDNEINVIHKFVRDIYSKRFPELESLVPAPLDYIQTVGALGNEILERSKDTGRLTTFLTPATVMVLSVTASTTQGTQMKEEEVGRLDEACLMAMELVKVKADILRYVESRMGLIAPNLSLIVGASVAAKLMGHAGGLTNLSKIPACNIQVLGNTKKTLGGMSHASVRAHAGYVFQCEIVQKLPPELRQKACKLVSAKAAMAARVDAHHESADGRLGDRWVAEIEKVIDKWQEPPPVKQVKALPAPIDPPAKKRGGRRYRKMKERLGLTDLRRSANRVTFGSIDDDAYQADLGLTVAGGALSGSGRTGSGKIRGPIVDAKTKARVSKALATKLHKQDRLHQQTYGGSTTVKRHVAGTASTVAFTPLQGFEIVNPQANEKKADGEDSKYFSVTSGFNKVKKE